MTIEDILKNPQYLGLPEKERKRVWESLFDRQYSQDPNYLGLPTQEQAKAKSLYVAKLMEQDRQAVSASLNGVKPYNPDADPINQAVNTRTITTFDSNITNEQGVIKPNLEGYDTSKKITAKEVVENKARQAGREYSRKQAENPFIDQQNPNAPGYMTTRIQAQAGRDQIRAEEQEAKAKQKAIETDQNMAALEIEYRDNDIKLARMSSSRENWTEKEQGEYSTLLQRQAKIETDIPAVAMGMSRRQYDAFQAGRELIKQNPAWSYLDALGAGGVRLITSPYTLFAPGSKLADVNRYADQGVASEGKVLGNIIRSTLASMPVNAAMMFAPQLAIPLTYTDITASNIKDYYDEGTLDASAMWASATSGLIQTAIEYGMDTSQMNMYRRAFKEGGAQALRDTVKRTLQDSMSNGFGKAARTIGKGTLTEMSEEVLQNVSDRIIRNVMNGDPLPQTKEEWTEYGKELAMDAAGGAFGGFVMGGIGTGTRIALHANTRAYIEHNAPRYQSVALLSQALDQINYGEIQAAEQTLSQAKKQAAIDQITAKPLMRGFTLATDALNMAKATEAVSVKIMNESLADEIRKLTSEKNDLLRQGHVAGFGTPQGERLFTIEAHIESNERQIKKNLSDLLKDKDLGKIAELYDMAKQLQKAGIPEIAEGMLDTAVKVYQGIQERETELAPGESRSIEEDEQIAQGIKDRAKQNKAILTDKLQQDTTKPLTETQGANTDQPAAVNGQQGASNDSADPNRIPGKGQERQTPVPPNPNPGTGKNQGKDTAQIQEGDGRPNQDQPIDKQAPSPLQQKGDLYIFRRTGKKPIFAVIERQDKHNFYTVEGKAIRKRGKTAIKAPNYKYWADERAKSEARTHGSRKSYDTKFGDKHVISLKELDKLPHLKIFRGYTFNKGDAPFEDVYIRIRGLKTEPLINITTDHKGENWDEAISYAGAGDLAGISQAQETGDSSTILEKAEKEYYDYFYRGRSNTEEEWERQMRDEAEAEEEERKSRRETLEAMSEDEREQFLSEIGEESKQKYLEALRDDIEAIDEESRDFEKETGKDYDNVQEYQEGDPEQEFDTSQYEDEVELEEGIQDNLEGIEPILDGDNLVDPNTGQVLFKTTDAKTKSSTDHLSNEMAEDALLGMFKSHIESIEHDGDTMTATLKGGRTLVLNQLTGEYQVRDHDGNMRTMRGKTDTSTVNGNLKVVIDLVKGLNGGNRTLYHEAFHAAWRLFLTPAEVKLITRYYAKKVGKNIIDIEEAAANAADKYLGNRNDVPPGLRTIFRRFWDRVRHFLVKLGFATDKQKIQDIFRRMENDQLTGTGVQDESGERYKLTGSQIDIDPETFIDNQLNQSSKEKYKDGYVVVRAGNDINGIDVIIHVGASWIGKDGKEHGYGLKHIEKHKGITGKRLLKGLKEGTRLSNYKDYNYILKINDTDTLKIGVSRGWDNDPDTYVMKTAFIYGKDGEPRIQTLDSRNGEMPHTSSPSIHPDSIVPKPGSVSRHKLLGIYGVTRWAKGKRLEKLMINFSRAEEMYRNGYNNKATKYATGWEIGIDGKWRYELPDTNLNIKSLGGNYATIEGYQQVSQAEDYPAEMKDRLLPHKLTKFPELVIEGLEDSLLDKVFEMAAGTSANWKDTLPWIAYRSRIGTVIGDRELTPTEITRVQRWAAANIKHILTLDLQQHKAKSALKEYSQENPSHALSYRPENAKGSYWAAKLGDLIDDKDLYKAYPVMKDVDVVFHPMQPGGYCNQANNIIGIDVPAYAKPGSYFTGSMAPWLKKILAHEIQHYIQAMEGFARGGNEKSAERDFPISGMTSTEKYMHLLGEVESRNVEARIGFDAKRIQNTPLEATEDRPRGRQLVTTFDKATPVLFNGQPIRVKLSGIKLYPESTLDYYLLLPASVNNRISKEMAQRKEDDVKKDKIKNAHYETIMGYLLMDGMLNYLATNRIDEYLDQRYNDAIEESKQGWRYQEAPAEWKEIFDRAWDMLPEHLSRMEVIRPGINEALHKQIHPTHTKNSRTLWDVLSKNIWNREDDFENAREVARMFIIELNSLHNSPKYSEPLWGYKNAEEVIFTVNHAYDQTMDEVKSLKTSKEYTAKDKKQMLTALMHLEGEMSDLINAIVKDARQKQQMYTAASASERFKTMPSTAETAEAERQMEEVRKRYEGTEGWMKAPNGKPSNLNERQWLQVRTQNFKDWFGDWENSPANASKVVDENGEPMVVYHGTDAIFNEFDTTDRTLATEYEVKHPLGDNMGAFFTSKKSSTIYFGKNRMATFLNIKDPKKFISQSDFRGYNRRMTHEFEETLSTPYYMTSTARIEIEKDGHDGVAINDAQFSGVKAKEKWFVAFSPTQIKSATSNVGTFSSENPDIRYKLTDAYHGSGAFFDRFDLKFIGTGEGAQAFGWGIYVTEREGVAKDYAEKLGRKGQIKAIGEYNGETYKHTSSLGADIINNLGINNQSVIDEIYYPIIRILDAVVLTPEKEMITAINDAFNEHIVFWRNNPSLRDRVKPFLNAKRILIKLIKEGKLKIGQKASRNLYTVNVWENHTEDVLDWRNPITKEQAEKISSQLKAEGIEYRLIADPHTGKYAFARTTPDGNVKYRAHAKTGHEAYHYLSAELGSDKAASEFLLRAGIDGIKYPVNALSGGRGEKGYNYVVFDANQISITHHERWKLLDEDIEQRLKEAKKLLAKHNKEYATITKQAAEQIAEQIVEETGIEPIAGKEKIARMIRAAYREGEEKARSSMAILKIAGIGQKIATNKPEGTDRSDMTFHLDEAEQYAKDMGISQEELDSLGADGYTFYAQGLNLFAYGNTLYDQLLEKRSQAAQNAAKGIIDQNLNEEISILTSATADAMMRYDHIKTNAGRILRHAREEKSMRIGRLVQLSISLNEERDRQYAELADLQAELAEAESMLTELEKAFEGLLDELERLTGQRYKSEYVDTLHKQKSEMEERIAIVKNRTQSLTHRINQAREQLKISESQITKIDEQIAKTELKLTPAEMKILESLSKSDKLNDQEKAILDDLLRAWRPLASSERNILKNAHDTNSRLNGQELAVLKKLWERKSRFTDLPPIKPSKWDIARSIFYQNILSSPMTHVKNLVGNESNIALENLVNIILDRGFQSTLQSIIDAKEGIKNAKAALQDGTEFMKKYDITVTNARLMRKFTLVTRILAAEDAFYYRRGYGAQLMSLAIAESKQTGIPIQELMVNPTAAMLKQAEYEASRATFNYDPEGILGAVVMGVEKAFQAMEGLGAPGRTAALLLKMKVLPFTRVVANVFNAGLDWTPMGFLGAVKYTGAVDKLQQRKIWTDANGKPIESPYKNRDIARQLIRATLGTIGMALAYALLGDLLSGGGSDDPEERRQMQETGWRPYSILIGDQWVPYTMLPISPALAVIANYNEARNRTNRKASTEESISYAMMGIMNTILDKSFLSGLSGAIEAVARRDKKYFMRSVGETPAQLLPVSPNFFRFFNDLVYRRQHNPETTAQYMMFSLRPWTSPWLKQGIPARIDTFGREAKSNPRWQEIIGSPIRDDQPLYVVDKDNIPADIRTVLSAITISGLKIPSTTSYEIKIEEDQYVTLKGFDKERYLRLRGMEVSMSMVDHGQQIEDMAYSGEIDELQKLLQKIGSEATRTAKKAMVEEYHAKETKHQYKPYSKSRDKE